MEREGGREINGDRVTDRERYIGRDKERVESARERERYRCRKRESPRESEKGGGGGDGERGMEINGDRVIDRERDIERDEERVESARE